MSVKIALIGAGSELFGPSSVADVLLSESLADEVVELVLMDIVEKHLRDTEDWARRAVSEINSNVSIEVTTSLESAVSGADFVITAIEVDRYLYWSQDFHVPRKHGFRQVYGENGGPGGLFHALRNMGPMIEIARAMERFCPDAYLLNFTNPEHKLCEAVSRLTSVRCVGLCHGVFMGIDQISTILGRRMEDLDTAACGINHFTFFQRICDRKTGEDLYPELREVEQGGDPLFEWHEYALARVLFRRFGLWPSPAPNHYGEYIRWAEEFVASELQYFYDPVEGHPWETGKIPEFVYSLSRDPAKRPWQPPKKEASPPGLKKSNELAIPLIEGIVCGEARDLRAVNIPNGGAIPNLPDDMVVEVPATADENGLQTATMDPLPEALAAMLRTQGSIHKLLVQAFEESSKDILLQAFLLDPTVDSYRRAVECVDEMIAHQREMLPGFG